MPIVFGGDTGIRQDAFGDMVDGVLGEFSRIKDGLADNFTRLTGKPAGVPRTLPKENIHVDDGFQNVPGTAFSGSGNIGDIDDIKTRKITTQTPTFTVYIKKKMFWSLRNEHDTKFMGSAEKLFIRATKLLFERKCSQIAAYEAMTKLEKLIDEENELDVQQIEQARDAIAGAIGEAKDRAKADADALLGNPLLSSSFIRSELLDLQQEIEKNADQIINELDRLKKLSRQSKQAVHTTWVIDSNRNSDNVKIGRGVGVIELTLVDSVRTQLDLEPGSMGSVSFSAQDPYNIMTITNTDVELALSSALVERAEDRSFGFDSTRRLGAQEILEEARRVDEQLRDARKNRLRDLTFNLIDNRNILGGADLAEIVFEVNPGSASQDKVTGRITSLSEPFNRNNFRLVFAQLPIEQNLTLEEDALVDRVFGLLENYVNEIDSISNTNAARNKSEDTEYARRQLRKYHLGKSIVQPMDGVHVYIRGNTVRDEETIGPLSVLLNDSPFVKSFGNNAEANDEVLMEEMRQFGIKNIPVGLYKKLRTSSLLRNAGTHVFGGLISTVSSSYNASRGEYILNVSGESNMKWLKLSRVNVAPSLDQPRGVLEDPLTPLKLEVDPATGLIRGNPRLSDENQKRAPMLFYKDGVLKGERLEEQNMLQDIVTMEDKSYAIRQHAPGLLYRWKEGVISSTQQSSLRTALRGGTPLIQKLRRDVGVTITKDGPFANLDVADVISLLITGVPHNYESFFLNSKSVGSFTPGGETNSPESYFHSFFDITRSTNRALGNFVPFKQIDITPKQMSDRIRIQSDLIKENNNISDLQSQIAEAQDRFNHLPADVPSSTKNTLSNIIKNKTAELNALIEDFSKSIEAGEREGLRVYGNDIIVEDTGTADVSSVDSETLGKNNRLRGKLTQMRPQMDTKLNTDNNLFVVSDEYDKDLDIQAFVTELNSGEFPLWNSQYKNPIETCVNAAKVIDFELFCDTQGNIQFRPPQYNKMPISLLAKMFLLSENKDVELYPPFVKSLFLSRRESLEKTSEILLKEIQIINLLLFGTEDGKGPITNTAQTKELFKTSEVGILGLTNVDTDVPDRKNEYSNAASKIQKLRNQLAQENNPGLSVSDNSEQFASIEKEVIDLNNTKTPNVNSIRLNKLNRLIQLYSRKQRVDDTLRKLIDPDIKRQTFNATVKTGTRGRGTSLNPGQLHTLLEPFGNLLEDDFNDFLGPGSSKRFTIYDSQIISYDFKESDSNVHCRVDVTGQPDLIGEQPGFVGQTPILWAGATDFDLWKQYGWRQLSSVNKPFFKNAELQCAPYALMLLSLQRRDAVRATITVAGNEYYQLGDVVYINSRDMLYYVYGVSHNVSFSGSFTTTLDLRYGHALGEFIPTPLDVIGKNIIRNQRKFNTTFMYRSTASYDKGRCAGVIMFMPTNTSDYEDAQKQMLNGDIGEFNRIELKNALLRINSQRNAKVDIRGFIRNDDSEQVEKVTSRMEAVKNWLTNPIFGFNENNEIIQLDSDEFPKIDESRIKKFDKQLRPVLIPEASTSVPSEGQRQQEEVKLEVDDIGRTPSEESYNLMTDPTNPNSEFNTVEIYLVFEED